MGFIGWIFVGGIAGWLAEKFMKADHGIFTNIFVGMLGGIVGGWVFGLINFGIRDDFIGSLITATVGACLIIWIYRAIRNKEQGRPVEPIYPPSSPQQQSPRFGEKSDDFTGMN